MSKCRGLGAHRFIQARAGFVSVAALLCLSAPAKLFAQTAPEQPTPSPPQRTTQEETLPPVDVEVRRRPPPRRPAPAARPAPAPAPTPPQEATTEAQPAVTGYRANTSGIGRLPVPLRDMPQTVNVVPQQVIQEQRANTMEDALRAIPGITFAAGEGGQQGDSPFIRGFVARSDLFRDGMRDPGWYTRDLFAADRVEVYKGPSAFAFGRGATGGAINTVTRLPDGKNFVEGTVTATTGPGVRAELDAGGKNGIWSGRIAALGMDLDTPTRDHVWTKRWGVAPSVSVDLGERTKATLSYIYQGEQGAPDYGFTFLPQPAYDAKTGALTNPGYYGNGAATPPLPVPRNTWYGIPTGPLRDLTEVNTQIATAKFEHELNKDTKFTNAIRYIVNERFSRPTALRSLGTAGAAFPSPLPAQFQNYPIDQMFVGRERRERQTNNTYLVNQGDVVTKFNTEAWQHTLAAGYEITGETREQNRQDICDPTNVACRTSVIDPESGGSPSGGVQKIYKEINTRASNLAMFASDQIKINKYFEVLASVRGDFFRTVYDDPNQALVPNQHLERSDSMLSYRFGAVAHPMSNISTYVAYGISYNPSAEQGTIDNISAANLTPERTFTVEAGVKADVLQNRLSLTGAIFRIEKTNLRITDPTDGVTTILDGIARVDGVEVGAAGKITDEWSVFAGYSYLQSRIFDTPDLRQNGRELPNTPSHNLTLWTTYALTGKLTLGGGVTYQSFAYANTQNTAFVPDYRKFDAMVSYKVDEKSTLQLNVYNLTDKYYYSQYSGGNVVPASGRWASLTYKVRW
jgi:catecholate siderophore receptor